MNKTPHSNLTIPQKRDERLDIFRGFAMMWVILIHLLYWLAFFKDDTGTIIKSWLMFEMPLFFFIAGASNGLSRKRSLFEFYSSRFQRILIPCYVYALLCIILMIIVCPPVTIDGFIKLLISWILPINTQISTVYALNISRWALWFIPVYIGVILIFPVLKKAVKMPPIIILIPLGLVFTALSFFEYGMMIKDIVFYIFWTYLGLFYVDLFKKKQTLLAVLIALCSLLAMGILVAFFDQSLDMQYNKFPPNFMFLLYSLAAMGVIYIISEYIISAIRFLKRNNILNWIFKQYQENGLTIFLFQPFVFILLRKIRPVFDFILPETAVFILYLMITIPMCAIIGRLFSWCEKIKVIK